MGLASGFWAFAALLPFVVAPRAVGGLLLDAATGWLVDPLVGQLVVAMIGVLAIYVGVTERSY